jgi:hypothetical protein
MSSRSAASTSGSPVQRSSSAGSSPASLAARAITSGSSSRRPVKQRTRSRRSSVPQRSGVRIRAATTARHAGRLAATAGGGLQAIGMPYWRCRCLRPCASRSGVKAGFGSSDSTTRCVVQAIWSP